MRGVLKTTLAIKESYKIYTVNNLAMRARHSIYDDVLRFQVELSFDLEKSFYRLSPAWNKAAQVLDYGAGNGYYTSRLAQAYPNKKFTCIEKDRDLASIAGRWVGAYDIDIMVGSFEDINPQINFDFVFLRHVTSYLSDRSSFFDWLASITAPESGLLLIDADDTLFHVSPRLPFLESGNEKLKDKIQKEGGDRNVLLQKHQEIEMFGFQHLWTRSVAVHSDIEGRKYLMYMFMRAIAEMDHGSPIPRRVWDELDAWSLDHDSFLQYGVMASYFHKTL